MKKIRNIILAVLAVLIAGFILLAVRASDNDVKPKTDASVAEQESSGEDSAETETPEYAIVYSKEGKYANEETVEEIGNTPVEFSDHAWRQFSAFLSDWTVEFSYSEMFQYDAADAFYPESLPAIEEHTYGGFIVDGQVDVEALTASVMEQSPVFKEENAHPLYTLIEDEDVVRAVVQYIAESINADLPYKTDAELAELDCVLGGLTMFYRAGASSGAAVTDDNALTINPEVIDMMQIMTGKDEQFRDIIYHEAKHLEQVSCCDREGDSYVQQGISRSTEELDVNPCLWVWSVEAAAELGSMDAAGTDTPTTYQYLVGYMESLEMISLLTDSSTDGKDVERSTFNRELDAFYSVMGVDEDLITRREIGELMYVIEIFQNRVEDFEEYYEIYYGYALEMDMADVRLQYKREALRELSRLFYADLARAAHNAEGLTQEDILCLITIYEADLNYHLDYDKNEYLNEEDTQQTLAFYSELQEAFFSAMEEDTGLSAADWQQALADYCLYADIEGETVLNASLSWMGDAKRSWLAGKAGGERIEYANPVWMVYRLL